MNFDWLLNLIRPQKPVMEFNTDYQLPNGQKGNTVSNWANNKPNPPLYSDPNVKSGLTAKPQSTQPLQQLEHE